MNYNEMKLPALKSLAKERKVKNFSTMRKPELVEALTVQDVPEVKAPESVVDAIKAAIRNAKEERSNKGRAAGNAAPKTIPTDPDSKAMHFALQRGSGTAKLTAKQERRVRKTRKRMMA
jgi:Rho termination factor-like protein